MTSIPGDLCPLCGDQLADGDDDAHPECLDEWRSDVARRPALRPVDDLDLP